MIHAIDQQNPDPELIKKAAHLIKAGNLVICPTDTAYMLAANALEEKAIRKVFAFKGRPANNPIHIAVPDLETAERYTIFNKKAKSLAEVFLPGPLTLILPKNPHPPNLPDLLTANLPTVGIRIPKNKICLDVLKRCHVPLTATSVNVSTYPAAYSLEEMEKQFGEKLNEIKMILDAGELPKTPVSTIVDCTEEPPKILREGPISGKDIERTLRNP